MTLRINALGVRPSLVPVRSFAALLLLSISACGGGDGPSPTGPGDPQSPVAARIDLTPTSDTLVYGAVLTLQASVFDQNGTRITNAQVSWTSNASMVISVDGEGRVEARGVGEAVIRATSGQASASAALLVEAKEYLVTTAKPQMVPLEHAAISLPMEVSALSQSTIPGTLGEEDAEFAVLGPRTVGFLVPDVTPGTLDARVQVTANEVATFSFQVLAAPVVGSPDEVIDAEAASAQTVLDALAAGATADSTALAAARDALASFQARVAAMSAEERLDLARLVTANPDLFEIVPVQAGSPARGPAEEHTPEDLARFAAAIDELIQRQMRPRGFADWCRKSAYKKPACQAAVEFVMAGGTVELAEAKSGLLDWLKNRIRKAVTREEGQPSNPFKTRYTSMGVRGAPSSRDESGPVPAEAAELLLEGTTYGIELDLETRTPTADDASGGALAPLGTAGDQFNGAWTDWDGFLQAFQDFLAAAYGLGGSAPTWLSPPLIEIRTAGGATLGLGAVSDEQVACTPDSVEGVFVVTCTTTALTDRDFTLAVHYTTPWESVTYEVPATIRPVHVLSHVSGDGQEGPRETPLSEPLVVAVRDITGAPVAGGTVRWAVTAGDGAISAAESTTGADGLTQVTWTLGTEGAQTAEATAFGPDGAAMTGSPVAFTADVALSTYVGTFDYSGVESQMTVEGISCTWQGTAAGTVRVVETASDSVSIQVSGTGDWPEGQSNTEGVTCLAETVTIAAEVRAELVNGSFSVTQDGWTLSGTISGNTVTGTLSLNSSETDGEGYSYTESGQGSFTATRIEP